MIRQQPRWEMKWGGGTISTLLIISLLLSLHPLESLSL
jgi:hypothetical protein